LADRYSSFAALKASEQEGVTYSRIVRSTQSPVAIIAPHGGNIEPTTDIIARQIAAEDHNLYCFCGERDDLHITSSNFDDPDCLKLLADCVMVVTIHGLRNDNEADVYVGGLAPGDKLITAFNVAGFSAASAHGTSYAGTHPRNICNRGKSGKGIQLEITRSLRDRLRDEAEKRDRFAATVRRFVVGQLCV
jgi:phage replication-related protein YjqB (UPF0714/DUF867 family)